MPHILGAGDIGIEIFSHCVALSQKNCKTAQLLSNAVRLRKSRFVGQ